MGEWSSNVQTSWDNRQFILRHGCSICFESPGGTEWTRKFCLEILVWSFSLGFLSVAAYGSWVGSVGRTRTFLSLDFCLPSWVTNFNLGKEAKAKERRTIKRCVERWQSAGKVIKRVRRFRFVVNFASWKSGLDWGVGWQSICDKVGKKWCEWESLGEKVSRRRGRCCGRKQSVASVLFDFWAWMRGK